VVRAPEVVVSTPKEIAEFLTYRDTVPEAVRERIKGAILEASLAEDYLGVADLASLVLSEFLAGNIPLGMSSEVREYIKSIQGLVAASMEAQPEVDSVKADLAAAKAAKVGEWKVWSSSGEDP
tara:strand:- start:571 stop:939 length:369 start_codon:yes stop_codon:yes gene_type:complete